ncbi:hypothetical protein EOL70_13695 [Leucothrix sargassi]|nr:hypothetical protein EOL70_13695 [Leucothrix sargassi]
MKKTLIKQHGLSLIELMLAMTLGLFVIIGISYVYISGKKTSMTTDQVSLLQENGRAVLQQLTDSIQHGGYSAASAAPFDDVFIRSAVASTSCSDGTDSVVDPGLFSAMTNNTTYGDSVGVVYMSDDSINTDCAGSTIPPVCRLGSDSSSDASKIYNQFFVAPDADGTPVLNCNGSRTVGTQVIAEGVENIQFVYGEDLDADGVADHYVNLTDVADWKDVVSVNISVLIRSLNPVAAANTPRSYQLSEDTVVNRNDRYLRSVFTATVRLRNVIL